ncbi:MAG: tetratricopeptide repeat protein, partial [Chlorobiaceae bacterium]
YDTALEYLNRSLSIQQEIGDSEGLCTTLFNLGQTHERKGDRTYAESVLVSSYRLAIQMNLSEILKALGVLAPHFGLPEGLAGWEMLAKQMDEQQEQS